MEGDLAACVDDDVAGLASGLGTHDTLHRLDLALERLLAIEGVDRHVCTLKASGHLGLLSLLDGHLLGADA